MLTKKREEEEKPFLSHGSIFPTCFPLTQVCHGVHAWAPESLAPEYLDGGGGDHQEDHQGHRQPNQQGEVRLQQEAVLGSWK